MQRERECRFAFARARAYTLVSEKRRREGSERKERIWARSSVGSERMWGDILGWEKGGGICGLMLL